MSLDRMNGMDRIRLDLEALEARLLLSANDPLQMLPDAFFVPVEAQQEEQALQDMMAPGSPDGQRPYGAQMGDTSEYMIGDVYVTAVLLESDGSIDPQTEDWTSTEIGQVEGEIQEGLSWWGRMYDLATSVGDLSFQIDFTYADNPVQTAYEPINHPYTDQDLWIDGFLDAVDHNSAAPSSPIWTSGTTTSAWPTTRTGPSPSSSSTRPTTPTTIFSGGKFAYAYIGGPFAVMTYGNDNWGISNVGQVLAHETGHIFYALDKYPAPTPTPNTAATTTRRT